MMFSLRTALICIHPLLAAFTLALPSASANASQLAPSDNDWVHTDLGDVRCLEYNQYGKVVGPSLKKKTFTPPILWSANATTRRIDYYNELLHESKTICSLAGWRCEAIGCDVGKGGIGWCNESEDRHITIPCHFLAEYVDRIVEICSHRAPIRRYVNGVIVSNKSWPGKFSVWVGMPPHPNGCKWNEYQRDAYEWHD